MIDQSGEPHARTDMIDDPASAQTPLDRFPRLALVILLLCVVAAGLTVPAQLRSQDYSPIDEHTHVAYAWDVAHGALPSAGSVVAPEVLAHWSCAGQANLDLPACGSDTPASQYPARGENYNFSHPPLYYAVTGIAARAVDAAVPGYAFTAAARAISVVWLAAGMILLYMALRRWQVDWRIALVVAAAVPTVPWALHAGTTVNNDAAAILSGAAAVLVLARIACESKYGIVLPVVLTALITSTKVLNSLPMLAVAGTLLVMALRRYRHGEPGTWELTKIAGGIVATVGAVFAGWQLIQSARGDSDWVSPIRGITGSPIVGLPVTEWFSTVFSGLDLVHGSFIDPDISGVEIRTWTVLLSVALVSAAWIALLVFRAQHPAWLLGLTAAIGLLAFPTIVQLQVFVSSEGDHYFPNVSTRYGMALIPVVLACWAVVAHRRRLVWPAIGVVVFGIALVAISVTGVRA